MAATPPPQGMTEADYDAIEMAVTETVRGRWFLNEFARRNRLAETRQLLDAMSRLEAAVFHHQPALPSADPSVRLLIQRIKEIAAQLSTVASDMRTAGIDERYVEAVDGQARAVLGMMRSPSMGKAALPLATAEASPRLEAGRSVPLPPVPPVGAAPSGRVERPLIPPAQVAADSEMHEAASPLNLGSDSRLAALSRFDQLSSAEKLALFT